MSPELRFDPLGRRNIILAPERARRGAPPFDPEQPDPAPCDFCEGREDRTPPETYAIRNGSSAPDAPGWRVRVVPNLYPATPFHEVVVHTPDHLRRFEDLDPAHASDVMRAYRDRASAARDTPAAVVVHNRGRAAGASRSHDHGQIFGLQVVPPTIAREAEAFAADPCALCTLAEDKDLHILDAGSLALIAHPVPLLAEELLIVPPCDARFDDEPDATLSSVARLMAEGMRRSEASLGQGVPFNVVFHTAPAAVERFHWHVHVMPRIARWAGLEMGAELPIVAADPYETARKLRAS